MRFESTLSMRFNVFYSSLVRISFSAQTLVGLSEQKMSTISVRRDKAQIWLCAN